MSLMITQALLAGLESSRIKARVDSLLVVSLLVAGDASPTLAPKTLAQLVDALFTALELEHRAWDSRTASSGASVAALEERASRAAQSLRAVVDRHTPAAFRPKQLTQLLSRTLVLCPFGHFSETVGLNLTRLLLALLRLPFLRDRLGGAQWSAAFAFLSAAVREPPVRRSNDRIVSNYLEALAALLNAEGDERVGSWPGAGTPHANQAAEAIQAVCARLELKPEPLMALTAFRIINKLTLHGVLSPPFAQAIAVAGIHLVELMVEHNNFHGFENLREKIVVFMNTDPLRLVVAAPQHLASSSVHSDDGTDDDEAELALVDLLLYACRSLVARFIEMSPTATPGLALDLQASSASWFEAGPMYLSRSAARPATHGWLLHRGLCLFLESYFRLRDAQPGAGGHSSKRLRADALTTALLAAATPLEFLRAVLGTFRETALLLIAFHLTLYPQAVEIPETVADVSAFIAQRTTPSDLAQLLLSAFSTPLALLCLNVLLLAPYPLSNRTLNQLLKAALPLVKLAAMCDWACLACARILTRQGFTPEKAIVMLLETMAELAEVSGPYRLGNPAFAFWRATAKHRRAHGGVGQWLEQKWSQLRIPTGLGEMVTSSLLLPEFIAWLCGTSVVRAEERLVYIGSLNEVSAVGEALTSALGRTDGDSASGIALGGCVARAVKSLVVCSVATSVEPFRSSASLTDAVLALVGSTTADLVVALLRSLVWCLLLLRLMECLPAESFYGPSLLAQVRLMLVLVTVTALVAWEVIAIAPLLLEKSLRILDEAISFQAVVEAAMQLLSPAPPTGNRIDPHGRVSGAPTVCRVVTLSSLTYDAPRAKRLLVFIEGHQRLQLLDSHARYRQVLGYLQRLDVEDALVVLASLEPMLDTVAPPLGVVDQMIELVGVRFLNDREWGVSEFGLVVQLRFMGALARQLERSVGVPVHPGEEADRLHALIPNEGLALIPHTALASVAAFFEITLWWISNQSQFCTDTAALAFIRFLASVIRAFHHDPKTLAEGDSSPLTTLVRVFASSSRVQVAAATAVTSFLPRLAFQRQYEVYTDLYNTFETPQASMGTAQTYCAVLARLSSASELILVHCLYNLLEYARFPYFQAALPHCLSEICRLQHFSSARDLFKAYRFDLLKVWLSSAELLLFPVAIFGYKDLPEFVLENYKELAAVLVSHTYPRDGAVLSEIALLCNFDLEDMVYDSVPYAVTLAYTVGGCRLQVFETLSRLKVRDFTPLSVMVVLEVVNRVDLSDEAKLLGVMEKYRVDLVGLVQPSVQLYCSAQTSLTVSTAVNLLNKQVGRGFWTVPVSYFLIRRLLMALSAETREGAQLMWVRRIKFVMVLGAHIWEPPETQEGSLLVAIEGEASAAPGLACLTRLVVEGLAPYIGALDVAGIISIAVATEVRFGSPENPRGPSLALTLALQLVQCRLAGEAVPQSLLRALATVIPERALPLLRALSDILSEFLVRITIPEIEACLVNDDEVVLRAVSLIFAYAPALADTPLNPVLAVSQTLERNINWEGFSPAFRLWRARYIGAGGQPESPPRKPPQSLADRLTSPLSSLNPIIARLMAFPPPLAECIIGVLLWKHAHTPADLSFLPPSLLEPYPHLLPLDFHLCVLLNPARASKHIMHSEGLATYIAMPEFRFLSLPFDIWATKLLLAFVNEVSRFSLVVPLVSVFGMKVVGFAKTVILDLVVFYLQCAGGSGGRIVARMMTSMMRTEALALGEAEAPLSRLVVEIALVLREGALLEKELKGSRKPFALATRDLDYLRLSEIALGLGLAQAALVFFEDHYREVARGCWLEGREMLGRIYTALGGGDLVEGLPVSPTLAYAVDRINGGGDLWTQVMVNNSVFERERWGQAETLVELNPSPALLHSLSNAGFNSLSSLLGDALNTGDTYGWAWKLGQWDVAAPEVADSPNKAIYKALKLLHDAPVTAPGVCSQTLLDLSALRSQLCPAEWRQALTCVTEIERCVSYRSELFEASLQHHLETTRWFDSAPTTVYESVLLCRRVAFEQMAGAGGALARGECWAAVVHELLRYGELSVLNGNQQKAMNSAMMVECVVDLRFAGEERAYLVRAAKFAAAVTLWNLKSTSIPIEILRSLQEPVEAESVRVPRQGRIASVDGCGPLQSLLSVSPRLIAATLVSWCSESEYFTPETIMEQLVRPMESMAVSHPREESRIHHMLAKFCHRQLRDSGLDKRIAQEVSLVTARSQEIAQIRQQVHGATYTAQEQSKIHKYHQKVLSQLTAHTESLNQLRASKQQFVERAVVSYLQALAIGDAFDEDVDRFSALWLEFSTMPHINERIGEVIGEVPTLKFLLLAMQLTSRLLDEATPFQKLLKRLLGAMVSDHPYHVLYLLKSLRLHREFNEENNLVVLSRALAADGLWSRAPASIASVIDLLSDHCLLLANYKTSRAKYLELANVSVGAWWLLSLPLVPVPSYCVPVSATRDYSQVPVMVGVQPRVMVATSGVSLPKIAVFTLSDGKEHRMLLKGGTDDLRQDAIMEQVFEHVNKLFATDHTTRSRLLRIRTYRVVPLGPQSGVLEFVANSRALNDVLRPLHRRSGDPMEFEEARGLMLACQLQPASDRIRVYKKIESRLQPQLRHFFSETFPHPAEWFRSREVYTKGVATTSILGHILGLGDRHNNNILLDKRSGEPIHIDLGVAFDQGKRLPVPELVPFRLTRDIVDGFGVTGTQGVFRKNCEYAMRVLRKEEERIYGILDVLRWDPLYSWTITPLRKQKVQQEEGEMSPIVMKPEEDASVAGRAVAGVREKLNGNGLSVEAAVRELISEAVDVRNLAVVYCGWFPFF